MGEVSLVVCDAGIVEDGELSGSSLFFDEFVVEAFFLRHEGGMMSKREKERVFYIFSLSAR